MPTSRRPLDPIGRHPHTCTLGFPCPGQRCTGVTGVALLLGGICSDCRRKGGQQDTGRGPIQAAGAAQELVTVTTGPQVVK